MQEIVCVSSVFGFVRADPSTLARRLRSSVCATTNNRLLRKLAPHITYGPPGVPKGAFFIAATAAGALETAEKPAAQGAHMAAVADIVVC